MSLWLRDVGLAKKQKQRITKKKREAAKRGAKTKNKDRIRRTKEIKKEAKKEIPELIQNEFWIAGVMLYWAEGTKQKNHAVSRSVELGNSDPAMIRLFISWLKKYLNINKSRLTFRMFIHENADIEKALKFWSNTVGCDKDDISVYLKTHNPKTNRRYKNSKYRGLLSVRVSKSTDLNRKIQGWINGLCERWGVV